MLPRKIQGVINVSDRQTVKVLVDKKIDREEYEQIYKELVIVVKDILMEIKNNKMDI